MDTQGLSSQPQSVFKSKDMWNLVAQNRKNRESHFLMSKLDL